MRILIVRPGAIGDTLLTFPVLTALRAQYAHAHISFVSNPAVTPLAKAWGLAEDVWNYDDSLWSELFSPAGIGQGRLSNLLHNTDLAVCWLRDEDGLVRRNLQGMGLEQFVIAPGRPPEAVGMHIIKYLAATVGLQDIDARTPFIVPWTSGISKALHESARPIAIHPGSGGAQKCWAPSSFSQIIATLLKRNYPILLLAGPADSERLQIVLRHLSLSTKTALLSVLENAPLLEVAQRLRQCKCYCGNDSGITHLAAMLGVPTLALFGPTNLSVWRPIGPAVVVLQAQPLDQLSVETVLQRIERYV